MDELERKGLMDTYEAMYGSREGIHELFNWMRSAGFTDAPASTRFHGSVPGGLIDHSNHVYQRLFALREMMPADMKTQISDETLFVVGFLHDLCKVEFYEPTKKAVKNPKTGKWEDVDIYTVNDRFPFGHGEKSAHIASEYTRLSPLEALAIRWHMGAYRDGEMPSVVNVWKKHRDGNIPPLVLMTHIADNIATHVDEGDSWPEQCKVKMVADNGWDIFKSMLPEIPEGISDVDHFALLFNRFLSKREGADKLLKYILGKNSDFAIAPASMQDYGAEPGGLCAQTIRFFYKLVAVCDMLQFHTMRYNVDIAEGGQPVSIKIPSSCNAMTVTGISKKNSEPITRFEMSTDENGNVYVNIPEPVEAGHYTIDYTPSQESLMESIAAVALLHGVGCIHTYGIELRNRKNSDGEWEQYPFIIKDEEIPWGSIGSKSVFQCQPFMRILRDESLAIRWFEGPLDECSGYSCGDAYAISPLAFCTHIAFLLTAYTNI